MIEPVNYNFNAEKNLEILSKGAFLTTKFAGKTDVMVVGWGSIGLMWRLPIFSVMVRRSRFTHELLLGGQEFSVTIPYAYYPGAIELFGTKSGRHEDKLAQSGLNVLPGQKINTPVLDIPGMHFECQVVYSRLMGAEHLNKALNELWYNKEPGNYHEFYFGEIVASYIIK